MAIEHPPCGARWAGLKTEHCAGCCETFSGTEAGDRHRVAETMDAHGSETRRCLTVGEMRALERKDGKPWFAEGENEFGTRTWSRNRPGRGENPAWLGGGRAQDQRAADPGLPVPEAA